MQVEGCLMIGRVGGLSGFVKEFTCLACFDKKWPNILAEFCLILGEIAVSVIFLTFSIFVSEIYL